MATTTEVDAGNTTSRNIKIQSNDGRIFDIDQGVVEQSSTIKTLSDCKTKAYRDIFSFFDYSDGCG